MYNGLLFCGLKLYPPTGQQGLSGLEKQMDHAYSLTLYLAEQIKSRDGFYLVLEVRMSITKIVVYII